MENIGTKQAAAEAGMQTTVLSPGAGLVKFARAFCGKAIGVLPPFQQTANYPASGEQHFCRQHATASCSSSATSWLLDGTCQPSSLPHAPTMQTLWKQANHPNPGCRPWRHTFWTHDGGRTREKKNWIGTPNTDFPQLRAESMATLCNPNNPAILDLHKFGRIQRLFVYVCQNRTFVVPPCFHFSCHTATGMLSQRQFRFFFLCVCVFFFFFCFFFSRTFLRLRHERRSGAHSGMLQCGPSLLSGALACLQGWGAASACQQGLRAARALPFRRCTPRREGAPGVRRRRRCAPRLLEGRTTELPTRTVQRTA